MRIHLFTTTYNNEGTLKSFIEFYKNKVPNIIIHITDMRSTDKTIEIAKENECIVNNFYDFYKIKDDWKNQCWKNIPSDCIVICNINDYIELEPLLFNNCSIIQCRGYNVTDLNDLSPKEETRNPDFDKFCIFDPSSIKEMNYEGHNCNPLGFARVGEKNPNLFHLTKLK